MARADQVTNVAKVVQRPDLLREIALNLEREKKMTNQVQQCSTGDAHDDEALLFGYYDEDDDDDDDGLGSFAEDGVCDCDDGGQPHFYPSRDLFRAFFFFARSFYSLEDS